MLAGGESRETVYTPAVKPVMDWLMVALSANATEVEAGPIAQGRAANQDVRQFGQLMVEHHTAALNELVVLAQAYGVEPLLAPVMPLHKRLIENLTQYSGQDFDRFYMRPMVLGRRTDIAHYELGVREQPEDVAAHAANTWRWLRNSRGAWGPTSAALESRPRASRNTGTGGAVHAGRAAFLYPAFVGIGVPSGRQ